MRLLAQQNVPRRSGERPRAHARRRALQAPAVVPVPGASAMLSRRSCAAPRGLRRPPVLRPVHSSQHPREEGYVFVYRVLFWTGLVLA